MNQKGQESAPFELLVAVVIMSFVIVIGMYAMDYLHQEYCFNETKKALLDFTMALEEVSSTPGSVKTHNLAFPGGCTDQKGEQFLKIKEYSKPALCAQKCDTTGSLCTLIEYWKGDNKSITECLRIPSDTVFPPQVAGSSCDDKTGETPKYGLQDLGSDAGFPEGYYLFQNKSSPNLPEPTICAYRKVN